MTLLHHAVANVLFLQSLSFAAKSGPLAGRPPAVRVPLRAPSPEHGALERPITVGPVAAQAVARINGDDNDALTTHWRRRSIHDIQVQ